MFYEDIKHSDPQLAEIQSIIDNGLAEIAALTKRAQSGSRVERETANQNIKSKYRQVAQAITKRTELSQNALNINKPPTDPLMP